MGASRVPGCVHRTLGVHDKRRAAVVLLPAPAQRTPGTKSQMPDTFAQCVEVVLRYQIDGSHPRGDVHWDLITDSGLGWGGATGCPGPSDGCTPARVRGHLGNSPKLDTLARGTGRLSLVLSLGNPVFAPESQLTQSGFRKRVGVQWVCHRAKHKVTGSDGCTASDFGTSGEAVRCVLAS